MPDAGGVRRGGDDPEGKEPQPEEVALLRPRPGALHLPAPRAGPELTQGLCESGATCVAYETVEDAHGRLPLLAPMSEVAGKIATQAGAFMLEKPLGGRGVLLGGVPGVAAATVMVIGGGVVGQNAAFIAIGMEADVFVFDRNIDRLRELDVAFGGRASTVYSSTLAIEEMLPRADLVIGAVLVHGARAPYVVKRDQLELMKQRAVLVDVSIDQGGCFETSRPTTHSDPVYEVDGVIHYCVANMPGAVPVTSTFALTNATLPVRARARRPRRRGGDRADPGLRPGVNVAGGKVTHPAVAEGTGMCITPVDDVLGATAWHQERGPHMATATRPSSRTSSTASSWAPPTAPRAGANPATGEEIADAPLSSEEDVDRAVEAAKRAVRDWSDDHAGRARARLLKLADALEENGEELADLESADAGKPREAMREDEMPAVSRQPPLLRGRGARLEGKAAGEYMEGYTSMIRREPIGVVGPDRAVELPADDGDLEDRPGARRRQHGRAEAVRDRRRVDREARRAGGEILPRACST